MNKKIGSMFMMTKENSLLARPSRHSMPLTYSRTVVVGFICDLRTQNLLNNVLKSNNTDHLICGVPLDDLEWQHEIGELSRSGRGSIGVRGSKRNDYIKVTRESNSYGMLHSCDRHFEDVESCLKLERSLFCSHIILSTLLLGYSIVEVYNSSVTCYLVNIMFF